MVHTLADDFAAEVARLCATPVPEQAWEAFLDALVSRVGTRTGQPFKGAHWPMRTVSALP